VEYKNKTTREASISLRLQSGTQEEQRYETSSHTVCFIYCFRTDYPISDRYPLDRCLPQWRLF
jgi:hypothetical protein